MQNLHTYTNKPTNVIDVLRVLQICDSNFPIGSFNHSFGMESYLRNNKISDVSTMRNWLSVYLNNVFIYSDGLAIRILYEYLDNNLIDEILDLDRKLTVQSIAKETREGSKLIAGRMISLFKELFNSELLLFYENKIRNKEAYGHPAIVFGILMYNLRFSLEEAINFHMYSTISTLIQNAVRAIPLGQKDGQLLIKDMSENFNKLYKKIMNMDYKLLGACSPGIELSQINHEILEFRLFMS